MDQALIVIDVQNDYFPEGKLPLCNTDSTLDAIEHTVRAAREKGIPVVFVQHLADPSAAPFFQRGTAGAEIHPRLLAAAPEAVVVEKAHADSFYQTNLEDVLTRLGARTLLICGMMTQNCVTHTAISKAADKYEVLVLADCCTTVSELIHNVALRALSIRVRVLPSTEALAMQAVK